MENSNVESSTMQALDKGGVVGSVFLQIGMEVKIIDNKIDFPEVAGKVLKITNNLKDYDNKRAFELNNRKGDIFLIEDFEFCVNYPHLEMR